MIACESCFDSGGCTTEILFQRGQTERLGEPLWNLIRSEGLTEAKREPLLRPMLEQAILERRSFADSLSMVISQRLFSADSNPLEYHEAFRNIVGNENAIADAAENDLLAIRRRDPATTNLLHPFLDFKGFLSVQAYRIAHFLWQADRRALAYNLQSRVSEVFGVDIHPAAMIGKRVFLDHATGIVIGETAVVGDDVTILHGVTLGATGKETGDRHPKVGDGVYIGAHAQLLGNIRIGENSRIGASSVVLKSVDPFSTVAGIPAQVVRRDPIRRIA